MRTFILFTSILISIYSCNKEKTLQAGFEGEDILSQAEIRRDKQSKTASLILSTSGKWSLYSGTSVPSIDLSHPLLKGEGSGTYSLNVSDSIRSYFQLVTEKGQAILAEKLLPITGGFNFRDLGGTKTKDGRYVKWGKIIRSDELKDLTDADLNYLSSIPLISIVDFRTQQEINTFPDKVPASVSNQYQLSVQPGNLSGLSDFKTISVAQLDSAMMYMNTQLVTDSSSIGQYKKFFGILQEEKNSPLLFHCTAGKDRTGMGAALILFALGADEEVVMNDYLDSNPYMKEKYATEIKNYPIMEEILTVKREFLQAGIDQIKKEYGSVETYLKDVLLVDTDKMKELYLY